MGYGSPSPNYITISDGKWDMGLPGLIKKVRKNSVSLRYENLYYISP